MIKLITNDHTYDKVKIKYHWLFSIRPGWHSRYSDSLRAGRSEDLIPVGMEFSAPVQTGPGAYPASYTMGTGVNHPLLPSAEVKERIELYLYFPSAPSCPVLRRNFFSIFPHMLCCLASFESDRCLPHWTWLFQMGRPPVLHSIKRFSNKDPDTTYSVRLLPLQHDPVARPKFVPNYRNAYIHSCSVNPSMLAMVHWPGP
jgi:hypothetical protein